MIRVNIWAVNLSGQFQLADEHLDELLQWLTTHSQEVPVLKEVKADEQNVEAP